MTFLQLNCFLYGCIEPNMKILNNVIQATFVFQGSMVALLFQWLFTILHISSKWEFRHEWASNASIIVTPLISFQVAQSAKLNDYHKKGQCYNLRCINTCLRFPFCRMRKYLKRAVVFQFTNLFVPA